MRGSGDEIEVGGEPGEHSLGQRNTIGPGHRMEGTRQGEPRPERMERVSGHVVDQALLRAGAGQEAGGAGGARRLQVRQGVSEGPYENQRHALRPRRNKLAGSYSDDNGVGTQGTQQDALTCHPLCEHLLRERVTQAATLVEVQRQPSLLLTEVGGQQAELEARGPDVLGVAWREAGEDALDVRGHPASHLDRTGHLGKVECLRSEEDTRCPAAYSHHITSGALRHDRLSF